MKYGLQLYSVRDAAEVNMEDALRQVSEMGYKKIEFAGFFNHPAKDVRSWLDKYGLDVCGTHTKMSIIAGDFDGTVRYMKEIGNSKIIIPSHRLWSWDEVNSFAELCREYIPRLRKEGIDLYYHNHNREFEKTEEGFIPEYEIIERTEIGLEIDTYWTFIAELDPVEILEKFKDRIGFIHLKDGDIEGCGCSLGSGVAPVKAVFEKAVKEGFEIVVESEGLDPTGLQEVKRCIDYIHSIEK